MITEVKKLQETRAAIRLVLAKLTPEERQYVRAIAFNLVDYLEQVQRLPLEVRLHFYRVTYCLYNVLRVNGQIGRERANFDEDLRRQIKEILSENLEDNGTGED